MDTSDRSDFEISGVGGTQPVGEFISERVATLSPSTSLRDAAIALRQEDASLAIVGEADRIDGVISERDLVAAIASGLDLDETTVERIESDSLKWAMEASSVDDVAEEMLETYLRHILVCDEDGGLAGVVSMRDLLAAYVI